MKKIFTLILIGIAFIFSLSAMKRTRGGSCLRTVKQIKVLGMRPVSVQAVVDEAFTNVLTCRNWPHNGKNKYCLFGIDDEMLLKHVADKSDKDNIYIIDAGCGNASWGKKAMETLFKDEECKRSGKNIYIFSITGGKECEEEVETKGKVYHYKFNSFRIENIDEEFIRRGFSFLVGNVDLIVSSVTFRHFVDPFGTLKRMYGLLSSLNGMLISDYFNFKFADSECCSTFPEEESVEIFASIGVACLFNFNFNGNSFILMRSDDRELDVPLKYSGGVVTLFKNVKTTVFNKEGLICEEKERLVKPVEIRPPFIYCFEENQSCRNLYLYLKQFQLI